MPFTFIKGYLDYIVSSNLFLAKRVRIKTYFISYKFLYEEDFLLYKPHEKGKIII